MTPNVTPIEDPRELPSKPASTGIAAIKHDQQRHRVNIENVAAGASVEGFTTHGGYSGKAVQCRSPSACAWKSPRSFRRNARDEACRARRIESGKLRPSSLARLRTVQSEPRMKGRLSLREGNCRRAGRLSGRATKSQSSPTSPGQQLASTHKALRSREAAGRSRSAEKAAGGQSDKADSEWRGGRLWKARPAALGPRLIPTDAQARERGCRRSFLALPRSRVG